jgi:hypothetical protein
MLTSRNVIIAIVILAVNLIIKLISISNSSYWYDEIITVLDTQLDFGHIKHEAEWDKNPPLYHYVMWIWAKFFGTSELAVRSMSAFFSSWAAVLLYFLVLRISKRFSSAVAAVLIFTLHPYLLYYAQEGRSYSFLVFIVLVDLWILHYFLRQPQLLSAFLLGLISFALFYTHYLTFLLVFAQVVYVFIVQKKALLNLVSVLTPILLVLVRFTRKQYSVLFGSHQMSLEKQNVPLASFSGLQETLDSLFVSKWLFVLFVVFGIYGLLLRRAGIKSLEVSFRIFLLTATIGSIVGLFLVGRITNVFGARYLLFTIPLGITAVALSIQRDRYLFLVTFIAAVLSVKDVQFGASRRMDYRMAAEVAGDLKLTYDLDIVVQTQDVIPLFIYYYDQGLFSSRRSKDRDALRQKDIYYFSTPQQFPILSKTKPILILQTYQKPADLEFIKLEFPSDKFQVYTSTSIEGVRLSFIYPRAGAISLAR